MTKEERRKQMDALEADIGIYLIRGDYLKLADASEKLSKLEEIDAREWKERR